MREILFRAKNADGGEWVEGYYEFGYDAETETPTHYMWVVNHTERYGEMFMVIPETVGQYTGLTDRKGKKIFEGDILKVKTLWHAEYPEDENGFFKSPIKKETYWSVEYKNFSGEMGFMVYGIDRRWHTHLTWNKLYNADAEVVGNIHDNPELLNK